MQLCTTEFTLLISMQSTLECSNLGNKSGYLHVYASIQRQIDCFRMKWDNEGSYFDRRILAKTFSIAIEMFCRYI